MYPPEKDSMIPVYLITPFFVFTYPTTPSIPVNFPHPLPPILSTSLSSPQPAQGRPTLPARNTSSPLGFTVGPTPGVQHRLECICLIVSNVGVHTDPLCHGINYWLRS